MTLTVAVVGGGQLARMMAPPATALGITLRVLVESPEAAAALPAHETVVGLPTDPDAVARLLAHPRPQAITWEHEHIPADLDAAARAAGVPALPGLHALHFAQDKMDMRLRMDELGLPGLAWAQVTDLEQVAEFLAAHGGSGVLKTARGGYDGKGVRVIDAPEQAQDWLAAAAAGGPRLLIEEKVAFDRELAALIARRPAGETRAWEPVESIQRDGVCAEVIAPAPDLSDHVRDQALTIAQTVAQGLDVVGVLAVEMFLVGERLLINELAMRPHNSGHWTIEGAVTSQFEQHLRAVLDLPLGDTATTAPWTVMANVVGGHRLDLPAALGEMTDAGAKVHLYGKGVRPGRKVGHVTVQAGTREEAYRRATAAAAVVRDGGAA